MTKRKIKLERSPFERKRNMTAPRGSKNIQTQISHDVEVELNEVIRNYNHEHQIPKNKGKEPNAPALKHIITDFLNTHCIEQTSYKNLNVIVIVTKENTCRLIGFIEGDVELGRQNIFKYEPLFVNEYNFIYALAGFNKENYDVLNLNEMKGAEIFNIPRESQSDFETVREHLQHDRDGDLYFAMFNLNNYLDILKDGVYVGRNSTYSHEGVIVLINPDDTSMRVYLRIVWSFTGGELDLQIYVEDNEVFNTDTLNLLNYDIIKEYFEIDKEPSRKELEERRKSLLALKEDIDATLEDIEQNLSQMK